MRKVLHHWHAGCRSCRQLIYVAANNSLEASRLPSAAITALCPYCSHSGLYKPGELILHSGYGTIYFPPDRNLSDTIVLVAGFLAAIKLGRNPDPGSAQDGPKLNSAIISSVQLAEAIVRKLAEQAL